MTKPTTRVKWRPVPAIPDYEEASLANKKKPDLDPDTIALLAWCAEVEELLVAAGATRDEAQMHIEEQAEWFTDQFFDGLSAEDAAKAALKD